MPRYTPNQQNSSAVQHVFELGEYQFSIGEPKPFFNAGKDQPDGTKKDDNFGILYVLTCMEGPDTGKKYFKRLYMHNQVSEDMSKQFMLAANGFKATGEDEKLFNDRIAEQDQSFNTDDGSCGDYWTSIKGGRVVGAFAVKMYKDKPQNEEKGWSPAV